MTIEKRSLLHYLQISLMVVVLLLTACGGGGSGNGSDSGGNTTPPTSPAPTNVAPTMKAIDAQAFKEQTDYTLTVTASDSDGSIAGYAWTQLSGDTLTLTNTGTATLNITTPDISTDSNGQLQLVVTDNDGASATATVDFRMTAQVAVSNTQAARFLTHATFGPRSVDITALRNASPSQWFHQQTKLTPSLLSPVVAEYANQAPFSTLWRFSTTFGFWRHAITGQDQLRQRMAFALSQLLVVSNSGGEVLTDVPDAVAYFEDLLIANAFGNYRDILEWVTYSPAMGYYLTYEGNLPADPKTGRMPDENYARELLQLFTIGVIELHTDGTPKLDANGQMMETYDNNDITGLAKVFTGLVLDGDINEDLAEDAFLTAQRIAYSKPMKIIAEQHSTLEKTFLGLSIPGGSHASQSIDSALDHIFAHANVAPFVGRQIIQRLVSSHPSAAYVERVASAFNQGTYQLPDDSIVGTSRRGDLAATVAAVLFDEEALNLRTEQKTEQIGKIREPILRFTHWARAFNVENVTPQYVLDLYDTSEFLAQHPYGATSVFNFFRPGYKAPGSMTGAEGFTAPELQITHASSIPSYVNFIDYFITGEQALTDVDELQGEFDDQEIDLNSNQALDSFLADYSTELSLANSPAALLDHLDLLLTYGTLSVATRKWIVDTLALISATNEEERTLRVHTAILMMMTSPDYLVQQ